jgi:AbrB family looped-hinge helix DNA binding protein
MALVRMLRGGQVTLPAEARKALNLGEGDYLDLEVTDGGLTLRPVAIVDRAQADRIETSSTACGTSGRSPLPRKTR